MKRFASLLLVLGASCASVQTPKLSYQDHIKQVYDTAEQAFSDKLYDEATKNFEEVRSKYPYSKYAVLSDLRIGDVYFAEEKWLEAADAYDFYLRFHPRHEQNAYAAFQIAQSYYKAIPKDFFLFPKSYLKDQMATQDALSAVDRYLSQYAGDKFVEEAQKMRVLLRSQLAARDLTVAQYYLKRKKIKGAMARLEQLAKNFADTPEGIKAASLLKDLAL